jgi:acyl carrier protein
LKDKRSKDERSKGLKIKDNDPGEDLRTEVQAWLKNWFLSKAKITNLQAESLTDIDYFAAGWLSSMEVVEFITGIEQQFGIQFTEEDMQDPRFATIAGLTDLILARSTQISESR